MPEYLIPIIERQVSRRYGWRRVIADNLVSAMREAVQSPDDDATDWGSWGDTESEVILDEAQSPRVAPTLVRGVVSTLVDGDQLIEPWSEQLRISDRLSIGCRVGHDEQRLYYCAEGERGTFVPLDEDALNDRPDSLRDLAYHLMTAIRSECVTLHDACAIRGAFTRDAERALHDFLTGRPCS